MRCLRSGTTFAGKLLNKLTGYIGDGESHASTLPQEIHYPVDLSKKCSCLQGDELIARLDHQALKRLTQTSLEASMQASMGGEKFIDKTPGSVACHGPRAIKPVFPNAAFVASGRHLWKSLHQSKQSLDHLKAVKSNWTQYTLHLVERLPKAGCSPISAYAFICSVDLGLIAWN